KGGASDVIPLRHSSLQHAWSKGPGREGRGHAALRPFGGCEGPGDRDRGLGVERVRPPCDTGGHASHVPRWGRGARGLRPEPPTPCRHPPPPAPCPPTHPPAPPPSPVAAPPTPAATPDLDVPSLQKALKCAIDAKSGVCGVLAKFSTCKEWDPNVPSGDGRWL